MNYISLFSGMECAHQAWAPLSWKCVAVAEIEPRACEVLAHRINASAPKYLPARPADFPADKVWPYVRKAYAHLPPFGTPETVPNFGDVSQVTEDDIAALGHVDVLIGGSPCQDLSIAGKRKGLAGARSSLFHQQIRIFDVAKRLCRARWLVWENVPGAFSSHNGRDFAVVASSLAGCGLTVPRDGWGNEGLAVGPNGLVEWSVLDAQWFGVAQRRRRVFAVLDTGNWTDRRPVLLEPESLRGDSAPRREAGERPAPTISARTQGGGGLETDFDLDGGVIALGSGQAGAEIVRDGGAPTLTCLHEAPIVAMPTADVVGCLNSSGGHAVPGNSVQDAMVHQLIPMTAHTLRGDGFDASEDGTGRGTPLVPVMCATGEKTRALTTRSAAEEDGTGRGTPIVPAIAFGCKDSDPTRGIGDDVAPTLRAMPHDGSHANAGGQVAVMQSMAVRRLTPRECERLQGVEDDWTLVPSGPKGKPMSDGPRYKMLGNSFARPVITWIGRQIQRATMESA